jgi:hypothetical protein
MSFYFKFFNLNHFLNPNFERDISKSKKEGKTEISAIRTS